MKQISIDGKAVLVNMDKVCAIAENYIQFDGGHVIWGKVDQTQSVDAELVKHGHWIEHDVGLICSECNHYTEAMYDEPFNNEFGKGWALKRPYYCGYCGAKMDEYAVKRNLQPTCNRLATNLQPSFGEVREDEQ